MKDTAAIKEGYFRDGEKFGEWEIVALKPPRRAILERRRNKWVASDEKEKDQTDEHSIAEWLFVLSRTPEQLTKLVRTPNEEWDALVEEFLIHMPQDVFDEFANRLFDEFGALAAVSVEPENEGKEAGEGTAEPSLDALPPSEQRGCDAA